MTTHKGQPPSTLLRPGPAAELLGVTTRTLINYEAADVLHPVKLRGGHRRYREAELLDLAAKLAGDVDQAPADIGAVIPGQMLLLDIDGAA